MLSDRLFYFSDSSPHSYPWFSPINKEKIIIAADRKHQRIAQLVKMQQTNDHGVTNHNLYQLIPLQQKPYT